MNKLLKLLLFSLITLLLLTFYTACSTSAKGKKGKSGEGTLFEEDLAKAREKRFGEGNIPLPEEEKFFKDIHFAFDSYQLDETAQANVKYNADILKQYPEIKVQLEGHCDERGTAEYNMALGQRRAQAVYNALVALGISASRLSTISYGEEVPLDPRHNEEAWAKNRRVHFSPYK